MVAYQVYGDGLSKDKGNQAAQEILELVQPDLVLLYMAPLNTLLSRRQAQAKAGKESDHFEKQDTDYHERTTRGYEAAAATFSPRTIDATGSVEDIHAATMNAIGSVLQA
jgi:thymidylate kinase